MATRINPGQCKTARALLKINISDVVKLSSHLKMNDIKEFEDGHLQLQHSDMKDLVAAFEKEHIHFSDDGRVTYQPPEKLQQSIEVRTVQITAPDQPFVQEVAKPKSGGPAYKVVGGIMIPQSDAKHGGAKPPSSLIKPTKQS